MTIKLQHIFCCVYNSIFRVIFIIYLFWIKKYVEYSRTGQKGTECSYICPKHETNRYKNRVWANCISPVITLTTIYTETEQFLSYFVVVMMMWWWLCCWCWWWRTADDETTQDKKALKIVRIQERAITVLTVTDEWVEDSHSDWRT